MELEVKVVNIRDVRTHENADRLDIATIAGYECVVQRDLHQAGDAAVYIPEASVLPKSLLQDLDLWDHSESKGKLAGPNGDRVSAIRLRGVVSQGLLVPVPPGMKPGDDAADYYNITKWEPQVPNNMTGVYVVTGAKRPKYDIDDILRWPDVLQEGEQVVYTEKIHGVLAAYSFVPGLYYPSLFHNNTIVASKSLQQHVSFKDSPENDSNIYLTNFRRRLVDTGIWDRVERMALSQNTQITIFGEIFGVGVQDIHYGHHNKKDNGFRVFDVHTGHPDRGMFLDFQDLTNFCNQLALPMAPVLYEGPHWPEMLRTVTTGATTIQNGGHAREGVVISTVPERTDPELGRVKLKSINTQHMFRKGNRTEYK